jgi:hypothetical protein
VEHLLLHICCAPDGAYAIDLLKDQYRISCYFYNPNIDDEEEYRKREKDMKTVADYFKVEYIEPFYHAREWLKAIQGYEEEKEGGMRCSLCYYFRLKESARKAQEINAGLFTSVLTISPHKKSKIIFETGKKVESETGVKFLEYDFKKKDGFKKSVILSKSLNLYRQNYCGCSFSKR